MVLEKHVGHTIMSLGDHGNVRRRRWSGALLA
jgi:hypothetical protein